MANYPVASGVPDYASRDIGFIPEIWSGRLLVKFYPATVFAAISNTDYEGEIKDQGNKVIIRTIPTLTIRPHKIGQKLTYERPESAPVELYINRGQYFAFICDDVQKMQSDLPLMDEWATDAAQQMKIVIDKELLADLPAKADALNSGNTAGKESEDINMGSVSAPLVIGTEEDTGVTSMTNLIVDAGTILDEQDIPDEDRWFLIPAWGGGKIKKGELRDASLSGDGVSMLRNGRVGRIDRFTLYQTNNLPKQTIDGKKCFFMPFGHKKGITFASQMTQMDTLKAESTFGQLVRGLNVYGMEVIKKECLGVAIGSKE